MTVAAYPANSGAAVDINPASAISANARYQPESVAIRYAGGDLTHGQLNDRAARLAAVLMDGGVAGGDRVAYLGLNSPAFLVTMFAAFRLGAIFVPVNFRLAGPELQDVLQVSGATAIVCEEGHREILDAVRDQTELTLFLLIDDDPEIPATPEPVTDWQPWSPVLAAAEPSTMLVPRRFDDPAILMFTSGTTGQPKGVNLTHGNLWWNGVNVDSRLDTRRGDTSVAIAPLFHIGGLNALALRAIVRGGTMIIRRSFDPKRFLRDLVDHRVNSFFAVPAMLAGLSRVPGVFTADLPSLHSVVVAGAPVPPSLIEQYAKHGIVLQQAWGLTETAPFATHLPAEHTLTKLGSAGIPMPHTEIQIVDPASGVPVGPGVSGEILVRGPNVTPGYWNNPDATAAAFDASGWFRSGDIGYLDADGYLYIVDRLKDMIISGGENIYPAEVERALADLPGLIDIAVVGAADEQWGEIVVAVACFTDGAEPTLDRVREHCATKLARYKLPRQLKLVEAIPRNASGKLDKIAIRRIVS
ncbi:long-chain fatty acid--CoA ligase [Mycobacterium sp.]|uniref:acyl-CoA synthetase n=1 Tax=Mycobacterium sp. TaxID=1785 RepID=UPI002BE6D104|nr:long-chain fatty acid--CoA ligase [Mycobacterium sp.]HKP40504.1 long-chain fatty acid--CoA ligase [Mycobacterium sp.]